jgi:hypothetical protein
MANTLVTPDWITYETATYFANSLRGVTAFNRTYSDEYVQAGAKVGDTVKVRLPQQFEASEGEGLVIQNLLDQYVNLILNRRRHVGFQWSSTQETTDLDNIRSRYVQPAAETLANTYDRVSMGDVYKDVWNAIGTLGTTPATVLGWLQAKVKLLDQACPDENIAAVLDPLANVTLVDAAKALFAPPRGKAGEGWTRGQFAADQLGIAKWYQDQNVPRFTSGACAAASTPRVNGASQTGSSIVTDGWGAASAPVEGDIITIAGVYSVNPLSKESTGRLQQFTLTATPTAGTGPTLAISPSIVTSGALQNVSAAAANDAVLTYWSMSDGGTQAATVSPQSLVFHPSALASVMADLAMPGGGARASRVRSKQINIAMRYVEQFAITTDQNLNRLDILFGSAAIFPGRACRVVG